MITVQLDHKHDICLVRKLLKRLLRGYQLKCVAIAPVQTDQEAAGPSPELVHATPHAEESENLRNRTL